MKQLILLIESSRADRPSYMAGLSNKGYEVRTAPNGSSALELIDDVSPDIVVIDAASMRTSGKRICAAIRQKLNHTPIILIMPEEHRETNDICADEVLVLPFTTQKLLNRVRPYLSMNKGKTLDCGPIHLEPKERWVHCNGKQTRLTPRLFILLETLIKTPGQIHLREDLFKKIWETDYLGDTRSLDVHISWLRKAIEDDPRNPQYIKTERGIGYRLEVEKPKRPSRSGKSKDSGITKF